MKCRNNSVGRYYDPNEGTVVYFDALSGDTHLLSAFAAHVMRQFDNQFLTCEELVNKISPAMQSSDVPELTEAVSLVLEELLALDILKQE